MLKQNNKYRTAFTVIELLIVMVVIGIITSFAVVRYNSIVGAARDDSVVNDANVLLQAEKNYSFNKNAVGKVWNSSNGADADLPVQLSSGVRADVNVSGSGYCIRVYHPGSSSYTSYASAYQIESETGMCAAIPVSIAPTCSAAAINGTSASLTFSSSGAISYLAEWGTTTSYGSSFTPATSPYTISSLLGSTTYYYRVTATNSVGDSASCTGTVLTMPNVTCSAVGGNLMMTVTFGGASTYTIDYGATTAYGQPIVNPATSPQVIAVAAGTWYYKVTGTNASGTSTCTGGPITVGTAPAAPTCSASSPSGTQLTLTYSAATATSFLLEWGTTTGYGSSTSQSASPYTIGSLSGNTLYYYRITPSNTYGSGPACTGSYLTLPVVTCSAVTGNGTFTVTFGGASSYTIDYGNTTAYGTNTGAATSPKLISVADGTWYYRVNGTNATGTATCVDGPLTVGSTPAAPTCSASSPSGTQLTLTYSSATATSYFIEWGTTTGYGTSTTQASSPYTVGSLSGNTLYYYRITPSNTYGSGPACTGSYLTLPVVTCSAVTGSGTFTVTFGGASTYTIDYGNTTAYGTNTGAATSPKLISVANGTWYYRVNGTNATGTATCTGGPLTVGTPPGAASCSAASPATTQLTLTYSSSGATSFLLEWGTTTGYGSSISQSVSPYTISTGLVTNTLYYYRVTPSNSFGNGTNCTGSFMTKPKAPSTCTGSTNKIGYFTITYSGGTATSYSVDYGIGNYLTTKTSYVSASQILVSAGTYTWRIYGVNASGISTYCSGSSVVK